MTDTREALLERIKNDAVVHGKVTLSSGREADYYVDLRRVTLAVQTALEDVRRALHTMKELHNLGDAVYGVRERECQGWEGPNVTRYAAAHKVVAAFLDGRALAQEAGDATH